MEYPQFEVWLRWADRCGIDGCDQPGVYLLGRFEDRPPDRVKPLVAEIIYIGETCSQTLEKRWYQFNRSAFEQKPGHSGGWTFANRFCNNKINVPCPWLYVAALPVRMDEPYRSAYIRFTERRLILDHVQRFGRLPLCNSK